MTFSIHDVDALGILGYTKRVFGRVFGVTVCLLAPLLRSHVQETRDAAESDAAYNPVDGTHTLAEKAEKSVDSPVSPPVLCPRLFQ
jgi:hypothetical protein